MMRVTTCLLAFAVSLAAQTPSPAAPATSGPTKPVPANVVNPAQINAQRARDVLLRTIQALGGEAYTKVIDMKLQARGFGFYRGSSTGVGVPFTRYYQFPDKERYEYFKEGDWVIIRDGDQGWEITFRGTRAEDPKSLAAYNRRRPFTLENLLRVWLNDSKTALFYDGKTIMDTKEVHKITLINGKNQNVVLYINAQNYLPVRKTFSYRDPELGGLTEEAELYDMFRVIQGVNTPFRFTRMVNGEITAQQFLNTVTYNSGIGSAIFNPGQLNYNKMRK